MEDRALAEQLEGLINLLKAVGIDSVDNREMKKASVALKNHGSGAPIVFPPDIPEAKELNDNQIEAMILKLQQAKAQAPQLMEALEDYVDQRNGGSGTSSKKKATKKKKKKAGGGTYSPEAFAQSYQQHTKQHLPSHNQHQLQNVYEDEEYVEEVIEEEVEEPRNDHDDYDENEEDDDFDEDADYPMVGPGISDDISVVSDMTTPTVVSSLHVHEEEQYKDMLPSMYLNQGKGGPPLSIQPPKRKNLVSKVATAGRGGGGPGGGVPMRVGPQGGGPAGAMGLSGSQHGALGAAAKRRQTYQQTMSRLHQNPYGTSIAGPSVNPNVPIEAGDQALSGGSYHSAGGGDFSFTPPPDGWTAFGAEGQEPNMDESGRESAAGSTATKTKKKTTKKGTAKGKAAAAKDKDGAPKSPKTGKKKKAVGATTIDRDGFLVGGGGDDGSKKSPPKKGSNGLSKSEHTAGGTKKKVVKKKVVKKGEAGEGKTTTKKSPKASKESAR